jgi:hypothetical protein
MDPRGFDHDLVAFKDVRKDGFRNFWLAYFVDNLNFYIAEFTFAQEDHVLKQESVGRQQLAGRLALIQWGQDILLAEPYNLHLLLVVKKFG